jgi:phosphoserine phosphatase RsbU/P
MAPESSDRTAPPASLIAVDPGGSRQRVELRPLPFRIGRQADNHLVLRDSRASRNHARIVLENGAYVIEDCKSRHGVIVNGVKVDRRPLASSDTIEFGFPDAAHFIFTTGSGDLQRVMEKLPAKEETLPGMGTSLPKLRAILEVGRALQNSFSRQDVLISVVDAALAVTGAERGFLLLRSGQDNLEVRVARDRKGFDLPENELRIPRSVIARALRERRELLSMNFEPAVEPANFESEKAALRMNQSVVDLDLRSVIAVPLVRIQSGSGSETSLISTASGTVGVLYMDSRQVTADLAGGNRELLQTLALEASTVLENARLLEEERLKQKMEEELAVARTIQQDLLPRELPREGWFRAAGSSKASHEVGGDYFDVIPVSASGWAAVVADVAGKGVSSALLASLLQGAFLTAPDDARGMRKSFERINRFLHERTEGGKYATIFQCLLESNGTLSYINAGHCAPLLLHEEGAIEALETTGPPAGLLAEATFDLEQRQLAPGDKIVIYSDGVTEAQNALGEFYGRKRLREALRAHASGSCAALHEATVNAVAEFTQGAPQSDDITLVVLEYHP